MKMRPRQNRVQAAGSGDGKGRNHQGAAKPTPESKPGTFEEVPGVGLPEGWKYRLGISRNGRPYKKFLSPHGKTIHAVADVFRIHAEETGQDAQDLLQKCRLQLPPLTRKNAILKLRKAGAWDRCASSEEVHTAEPRNEGPPPMKRKARGVPSHVGALAFWLDGQCLQCSHGSGSVCVATDVENIREFATEHKSTSPALTRLSEVSLVCRTKGGSNPGPDILERVLAGARKGDVVRDGSFMFVTCAREGNPRQVFAKGATADVVRRCNTLLLDSGKTVSMSSTAKQLFMRRCSEYEGNGFDCVSFAFCVCSSSDWVADIDRGMVFVALAGVERQAHCLRPVKSDVENPSHKPLPSKDLPEGWKQFLVTSRFGRKYKIYENPNGQRSKCIAEVVASYVRDTGQNAAQVLGQLKNRHASHVHEDVIPYRELASLRKFAVNKEVQPRIRCTWTGCSFTRKVQLAHQFAWLPKGWKVVRTVGTKGKGIDYRYENLQGRRFGSIQKALASYASEIGEDLEQITAQAVSQGLNMRKRTASSEAPATTPLTTSKRRLIKKRAQV